MKKLIILFVALASGLMISMTAQETPAKFRLETAIGINVFGPANGMNRLMVDYGFDYTTNNWLWGGTTAHPHYAAAGFSAFLAGYIPRGEQRAVGLRLHYNNLREILGASATAGFLFVEFSSFILAPVYVFEPGKYLDLEFGPALMINSGKRTSDSLNPPETYTRFSPAISAGLFINLWERKVTSGRLGVHGFLSPKTRMGPFSAENFTETVVIPESGYGFSHMNLTFSMGFHL